MYKHTKKQIGSVLRGLRTSHQLTQGELADILGTFQQNIARWECGAAQPDLDTFFHICDIFQVYDVLRTFGYGASQYPSFDSAELRHHPYFNLVDEYCNAHSLDSRPIYDYFFVSSNPGNLFYVFSRGKPNLADENAVAHLLGLNSHNAIYSWGIANDLWSLNIILSPEERDFILKHRELSKNESDAGKGRIIPFPGT